MIAQRISMVSGVAQVQVFGPQKYAVRVDLDPQQLAAAASASTRSRGRRRAPTSTCRPAILYGPEDDVHGAGQRPADGRGGVPAGRSSPTATASPCGSTRSAHVFDGVENDKTAAWYNGERAISLADLQAAGHQHGRRSRRRSSAAAADLPGAAAGRGQRSTSAAIAPSPIRESVDDVKFTLLLTVVLVVLVIFLFLRNVSATIIPSLALPALDRRHVRGDVPARLQPRQPVADGAHALGRLRRRRRDRDAREHRPAHGDGQGADARRRSTDRRRSRSRSSR